MKKWLQIIVCLIVIAGFGTAITVSGKRVNYNYNTAMNAGSSSIDSENYSGAVDNLTTALRYDPNQRHAQNLLKQTQYVMAGNLLYQQKQFAQAIPNYQKAIDLASNDKLTGNAKQSLANAQGILDNYRDFVWSYDLALHMNQQGEFKDSEKLLNMKIITSPFVSYTPFKDIVTQARKLQNANQSQNRLLDTPMITINRVSNNIPEPTAKLFSISTASSSSSNTNASQMLSSSTSTGNGMSNSESSFSFGSSSSNQTETSSIK